MTDEVATLVLADNVSQARALTLDSRRSAERYDDFLFVFDHMLADRRGRSLQRAARARDELAAGPSVNAAFRGPVLAVAMGARQELGIRGAAEGAAWTMRQPAPFVERYFPQAHPRSLWRSSGRASSAP